MSDLTEAIEIASREGEQWVPKYVEERLLESARIIVYTTKPAGPRGYGSGYPNELASLIGLADRDTEWWRLPSAEDQAPKRNFPAHKVTQAEAASRWPIDYLPDHDGPRRVLMLYLRCKIYRKPFSRACKQRKWPRATAYRALDKAFAMIAQGLNRDGVEVA